MSDEAREAVGDYQFGFHDLSTQPLGLTKDPVNKL